MFRCLIFAALATFLVTPALAQAEAPAQADITGKWATGTMGGIVEIYRCGSALCGRLVDSDNLRRDPDRRDLRNSDPAKRDRKLMNLVVLQNFTGGPPKWKGGPVYDPSTGDGASKGRLELRPDGTLKVSGCFLIACRSKVWTRVQ